MNNCIRSYLTIAVVFLLVLPFSAFGQGIQPPSPSAARAPVLGAVDFYSFIPSRTFENLDGSTAVSGAWQVRNGEFTGSVGSSGSAVLLLDAAHQDLSLTASFACTEDCTPGIMIHSQSSGDGTSGILYLIEEEEVWGYDITFDANGYEFLRKRLNASRFPYPDSMMTFRSEFPGLGNFSTQEMGARRATTPLHLDGEWNHIEIVLIGNTLRGVLNGAGTPDIYIASTDRASYGRIGLYVSGPPGTEIRFKEVGIEPFDHKNALPPEITSPRFRKQQLESQFQAESVTAADFNLDGHLDINAGPNNFLGPDFLTRQEIYIPREYPPNSYPDPLHASSGDFTGDGYPDILHIGEPGRPGCLYVNPGTQTRRWDKYTVIGSVDNEIAFIDDVDGDGKLEYVYGDGGFIGYAKPGPDATKPWTFYAISEKGPWGAMYAHGLGTGDINGDGRKDFIQGYGWWEQPEVLTGQPWTYHPEAFGRWGTHSGGAGGAAFVYDVNGDCMNDIVTSLDAHGFGLAWFEQKRDAAGNISFEEHLIMGDYRNPNNGVSFSEIHALMLADIDGDGLDDIVAGKRWKGHFGENPTDPDSFGDPVIYWFKLIRENGEVRYIPELVNNHSGVGNDMMNVDLNKDGLPDIMTSTRLGTMVFLSQR